jgi:hypothetical protein
LPAHHVAEADSARKGFAIVLLLINKLVISERHHRLGLPVLTENISYSIRGAQADVTDEGFDGPQVLPYRKRAYAPKWLPQDQISIRHGKGSLNLTLRRGLE